MIELVQLFETSGSYTPTKASLYLRAVETESPAPFTLSASENVTIAATNYSALDSSRPRGIVVEYGASNADTDQGSVRNVASTTTLSYPIIAEDDGKYSLW